MLSVLTKEEKAERYDIIMLELRYRQMARNEVIERVQRGDLPRIKAECEMADIEKRWDKVVQTMTDWLAVDTAEGG